MFYLSVYLGEHGIGLSHSIDLLAGRSNLGLHELDDTSGFAGPVVVQGQFSISEDLVGSVAVYLELPAGVLGMASRLSRS